MNLLNKSLDAFRAASPDQDALAVGAAVFFDVPYAEVAREQRASWKWLTSAMRAAIPSHVIPVDQAAAITLRERIVKVWPELMAFVGQD